MIQGKTNERHQILNEVGATIEVARRCVDDNKDHHCSFGLHVGSFDYADGWAGEDGRLLLVEFDPADAVSVPTDCDFQKLRVSKYKVISDITDTRKELNKPIYEANKPIYGSNEDSDYENDDFVDLDEDDDLDNDVDNFLDMEDDDNYDLDEHGEPKVVLPDNYDDDYNRIADHYLNNPKDYLEANPVIKSISNYLKSKAIIRDSGETFVYPTIKQIADLRICKSNHVGYEGVKRIVESLGYTLSHTELPLGQQVVSFKDF